MQKKRGLSKGEIELVVYNVRSVGNVGSLFRTADGAGVSFMHLVGYTPAPHDRFGRVRLPMAKVSLGAEQSVPYKSYRSFAPLVRSLRKRGFSIVALEQSPYSINYRSLSATHKKIALVVGTETDGLPYTVLEQCDCIAEIPLYGSKESLNVTVATGVALFSLRR
jgi:tRNA G18 (ribose-2'-O)-methylase SpoU